jgi:hypothetical protein
LMRIESSHRAQKGNGQKRRKNFIHISLLEPKLLHVERE